MGVLLDVLHLNPNTGFGAIQSVCEGESALCKKRCAESPGENAAQCMAEIEGIG
jgi:hypothetical protein